MVEQFQKNECRDTETKKKGNRIEYLVDSINEMEWKRKSNFNEEKQAKNNSNMRTRQQEESGIWKA